MFKGLLIGLLIGFYITFYIAKGDVSRFFRVYFIYVVSMLLGFAYGITIC